MARLDVCNFCNGHGYVHFYGSMDEAGDDQEPRPCPLCTGSGQVESWRQVDTGVHLSQGLSSPPSYREMNDAIRAIIRQRDNG